MFQGQAPFYFATLRKITVAFGSLFNNIKIVRYETSGGIGDKLKTISVPLSYASGNKWYVHRIQDIPAQEKIQTKVSLPRIGFQLTGLQYDANRKTNTLNKFTSINTEDPDSFLKQLNPSPYDLAFDVYIAIKNMDDGLQIIEQILPYFQPSYTLNVKDIPELDIVRDINVILMGVDLTDDYEGSFEDDRVLEWKLTFVVKAYLYPVIGEASVIKKVIASIYKDEELIGDKNSVITVKVDPIAASFEESWAEKTNIYSEDELDSNGNPIIDSNG